MSCPSYATLADYKQDDSSQVSEHLATCSSCRRLVALGLSIPDVDDGAAPDTLISNRYTLLEVIGRGGQAVVWRARDRVLDRDVAYKTPRSADEAKAHFMREARVLAKLDHPNIATPFDFGVDDDGLPYFTQPILEGRSLRDEIADKAGPPQRLQLLPRFVEAARAVAYAHGQGIYHRDLKPDNILVGDFGKTFVIDWGLAHLGDSEEPPKRVVGTPGYMSPEQRQALAGQDHRADVWSLGAILHELLIGGPPGVTEAGDNDGYGELYAIMRKATADKPSDRYDTVDALVEDLERYQAGRLVSPVSYRPWQVVGRYLARYRIPVFLSLAAILSLAIVLVVVLRAKATETQALRAGQVARAAALETIARAHLEKANTFITEEHIAARAHAASALKVLNQARILGSQAPQNEMRADITGLLTLTDRLAVSRLVWKKSLAAESRIGSVPLVFSPDGDYLALSDGNGVYILESSTGRELTRVTDIAAPIASVAWSASGQRLAITSLDQIAIVSRQGQAVVRIPRKRRLWRTVDFIDEQSIAVASVDGRVEVFDDTGRSLKRKQFRHAMTGIQFHAGQLFVYSLLSSKIFVVSASALEVIHEFDIAKMASKFDVADGKLIYCNKTKIASLDLTTATQTDIVTDTGASFAMVKWMGDGAFVYVDGDGKVGVRRLGRPGALAKWQARGDQGDYYSIAYHRRHGIMVGASSGSRQLYAWSGDEADTVFGPTSIPQVNGSLISWDGEVQVLSTRSAEVHVRRQRQQAVIRKFKLDYPAGYRLITRDGRYSIIYKYNTVEKWDNFAGVKVSGIAVDKSVFGLTYARSADHVGVSYLAGGAEVFDLASGKSLASFATPATSGIGLSPDAALFIVNDAVYRVATKELVVRLDVGPLHRVVFRPDGRRAALAGDRGIAIWDRDSQAVVSISDIDGVTHWLGWSASGRWLFAEKAQGVVFDAATMTPVVRMPYQVSVVGDDEANLYVSLPHTDSYHSYAFRTTARDADAILTDIAKRFHLKMSGVQLVSLD